MTVDDFIESLKRNSKGSPFGSEISKSALEDAKKANPNLPPEEIKKIDKEIRRLERKIKKEKIKQKIKDIENDFN